MTTSTPAERTLPLRERKKLRTRRALADTALRLFLERGFQETTLDQLVDAVEVSKRTFFRMYESKEDVAMAAELELWDAYVAEVAGRELHGPVLDFLRETLVAAIRGLGDDWDRRFLATRGLIARTPALWDRSLLRSITVQTRLVNELETKLGLDSRDDVRLRLLGELSLAAWRCAAKNWVSGRGYDGPQGPREKLGHWKGPGGSTELIRRVEDAFHAIPDSLTLTAP
ncbi:TetR family transcriptional regulator [Amycolatopsis nalaikhensis]|uniref:TetR family transcriptional regulator n=1 Tax=Amycolatopsis nalaikhensis TaxID=715472 RepID=A0ABY8XQN1_9PSEU|nr:TetR family transcriptional regulator [Amycolatopsis sp. 2-2]WIV57932.1 TetR family transcriptional regulator [Amycolatopsis sp. 2-2]